MMGFDAWSEGKSEKQYLGACQSSSKYRKGQWYVLAHEKRLLSSLVLYQLPRNAVGIGSIATPPEFRRRGYASQLISGIVSTLEASKTRRPIFLFADIAPEFYGRFGFVPLPIRYQTRPGSICMVHSANLEQLLKDPGFVLPSYF